jgi:hypothetical protein
VTDFFLLSHFFFVLLCPQQMAACKKDLEAAEKAHTELEASEPRVGVWMDSQTAQAAEGTDATAASAAGGDPAQTDNTPSSQGSQASRTSSSSDGEEDPTALLSTAEVVLARASRMLVGRLAEGQVCDHCWDANEADIVEQLQGDAEQYGTEEQAGTEADGAGDGALEDDQDEDARESHRRGDQEDGFVEDGEVTEAEEKH